MKNNFYFSTKRKLEVEELLRRWIPDEIRRCAPEYKLMFG
jgi:hypothetical protein